VSGLKQQMLADGVGVETTRRTLTMLQGVFRLALEWEEATSNPFAVVRKPPVKPPAPVQPLSVEAVERLRAHFLDAEEWESVLIVVLMAYAGLRPSEVAGLRVGDVRERTLLVHRTMRLGDHEGLKNGSAYRTVELLRPAKDDVELVLDALGSGGDADVPLIPDGSGGPRNPDDYKNWRRRHFRPAVRHVGLSIRRPYDLRHTCASLLIAAQRNILEIAAQLGHRPEMTLRAYGHLIDEYRGQPPIDIQGRIATARARG
jgi:integrase